MVRWCTVFAVRACQSAVLLSAGLEGVLRSSVVVVDIGYTEIPLMTGCLLLVSCWAVRFGGEVKQLENEYRVHDLQGSSLRCGRGTRVRVTYLDPWVRVVEWPV